MMYRWMMNWARERIHKACSCDWLCPNCLRWTSEVGNVTVNRTKNPTVDVMICHACGHKSVWNNHGPVQTWADGENVAYERLAKAGIKDVTLGGLDNSGISRGGQ